MADRPSTSPEPVPTAPSLGELLGALIVLEETDLADILRIRSALAEISESDPALTPVVRRLVAQAVSRLDASVAGEGTPALEAAVRLLGAAAAPGARPADEAAAPAPPDPPPVRSGHPSQLLLTDFAAAAEKVAAPPSLKPATIILTTGDDGDDELLQEFVTEAQELLAAAEQALLALEADPTDRDAIGAVFRAFHTIKGVAGMLNLGPVRDFAHRAENLLSRMRDGEIRCTGKFAELALRSIDALKVMVDILGSLKAGQTAPAPDDVQVLLDRLAEAEHETDADVPPQGVAAATVATPSPTVGAPAAPAPAPAAVPAAPPAAAAQVPAPAAAPGPARDRAAQPAATPKAASARPKKRSNRASRRPPPSPRSAPRSKRSPTEAASQHTPAYPRVPSGAPRPTMFAQAPDGSIRVRTDRLDRLIDLVGELVIAQSMVAQDPNIVRGGHFELHKKIAHTDKIIRGLQELTMSLRMVPLRPTFQKMSRIVRDIGHKFAKDVRFVCEGEDTEIDRNMVDVIADPLVHLIRNAADHGIETAAAREGEGKPPHGTVRLNAFHAGGHVVIQVGDDGRGIDRRKIVAKAIDKGLIRSDAGMSDQEVYNLIFEAGFSTNDKVTDISGRGVGMDVVRRGIESLNGRIDIHTELGAGTTFSIHLPLTLAITDGMLVRVGAERFIVPTGGIVMSLRPEPGTVSRLSGRGEIVRIRDEILPLVRLHHLLGVEDAELDPYRALVVVLDDGQSRSALLVDEILGQQQVVTKSLGENLGCAAGVAGGAVLGDGRIGLILDPSALGTIARQQPSWDGAGTQEVAA